MKTLKILLPLVAVLLCGHALAQTIYVDDTGPDCSPPDPITPHGDGSQDHPYCFIGHAVLAAQGGETIRVMPGTYSECFDTGATQVSIVADDSNPALGPADFVIDPNFLCDTPVTLGNGSSLDGFTVRGGNISGLLGIGSVVITNNVITGNNSPDYGGGMYVIAYGGYFGYGDIDITIENNTIDGNTAKADGGGAYLWTSATGTANANVLFRNNVVSNNTVAGPPADTSILASHGGGISAWTSTAADASASILITQNTISANDADFGSAYYAYGGGVFAQTYGFGTDSITVENNSVTGNTVNGDGGGIGAWMYGDSTVAHNHQMLVRDNTVSGNTAAGGGGGVDLFAFADTLGSGVSQDLTAEGNLLTGNTSQGTLGGGGASVTLTPINQAGGSRINIQRNTIRNNIGDSSGGGMALVMYPFANSGSSSGLIKAENNLIVQNSTGGFGGGVDAFVSATLNTTGTIDLEYNTISDNTAVIEAGGVSLTAGTNAFNDELGTHAFQIDNSILSDNTGFAVGLHADDAEGPLAIGIDYNVVFGNTPSDFSGVGVISSTNVSEDPLLDASWTPDVCSPAVDGADPADPFANEPEPNGNRANAGWLGNTNLAVTILADTNGDNAVDGLDILALATAFASGTGDPRYDVSADIDQNGTVEGPDLALVGADFGLVCP